MFASPALTFRLPGIAYLHENGIFHRDIKPDNALFLADTETVKIVDFGVSEMFVKKDDRVEKSVGSPAFMAPELCAGTSSLARLSVVSLTCATVRKGELHGAPCDVWSLGVTLFTLVVGRLPWAKPDLLDLFKSIVEDPYVLPLLSRFLANLFVAASSSPPPSLPLCNTSSAASSTRTLKRASRCQSSGTTPG